MDFSQIPAEVPESIVALLWVIVTVLTGAVVTLFWQLQKEKDRHNKFQVDIIQKVTQAIITVDGSLTDVVAILDALDRDLKLQDQIQEIRTAITRRNGGST